MNIDMDKRSTVKNLCNWRVSFTLPITNANILLDANKKTSINNGELVTLIENGNVMFVGTGNGNHARIYVENDDLRKYVGFDSEDGKARQFILNEEECERILDYKTFSVFKKHVEDEIVCEHEKHIIMSYARKIKLNDYEKIAFLEEYTKMKFKE